MISRAFKSVRKVKVLGYPFAGGQGKCGVELTPAWLKEQPWLKSLPVEFEMVSVSEGASNSQTSDESSDLSDEV